MKKTMIVAIAILAIVLGIVAYASADTAAVVVNGQVKGKLLLTVATAALTIPDTDPGAMALTAGPTANVKSNKIYTFTTGWSLPVNSALPMWSDTYVNSAAHARSGAAGDDFTGNVRFTPDYSLDALLPSQAQITFTATQN